MTLHSRVANRVGASSWRLMALLLGVVVLATAGGSGWWLMHYLRHLRDQRANLEQRDVLTEQQLKALEQQYASLKGERQQLLTDRDNILAQYQRAAAGLEHADAEREMLEQVFKRAAGDRLELKNKLEPLEGQHAQLLQDYENLIKERDSIQHQLAEAQARSEEKRLKEQLGKETGDRKKLEAKYRDAQRLVEQLKNQRAKAEENRASLTERFETLQARYAKLMADNKTYKKKAEQVPNNVTQIAREHERLVKDVADTHYNMGVLFSKKDDYVRAEKEFQKVIELKPDDADAYYNLGVIYAEHIPDREKAIRYFQRFLALNPNGQDANWAKEYIATWKAWEGKERLE